MNYVVSRAVLEVDSFVSYGFFVSPQQLQYSSEKGKVLIFPSDVGWRSAASREPSLC